MVKTRGLKEAKNKLGNLEKVIENMLKKKKKIRIFEAGCGYGKVMLGLSKKFGDLIEIIGMNLNQSHGGKKKMISFALSENIISKNDVKTMKIPKIIYGDAGKKLPFKTNSIDLIYSQASVYLYKDKLHFFEEVARVLSKKGIARITPPFTYDSKKYGDLLLIYINGKKIQFEKFVKNFNLVKIKKSSGKNKYIEIEGGKLNFNLKLKSTLNINKLNKKWFGVQSVYYIE